MNKAFFSILALALMAIANGAIAADYNWGGFYAGVEAGGGFGKSRRDFDNGATIGNFNVGGALGGLSAGYNWQFGSIVAGVEGDISASNVNGNTPGNVSLGTNPAYNFYSHNYWLGTLRPRLGYAFGSFLPYVTGGLAEGDVRVQSGTAGATGVDFTRTEPGWTMGAGVEAGIGSGWTVKAEYLYAQLEGTSGPSTSPGISTNTTFNENIVRLGLNYKF